MEKKTIGECLDLRTQKLNQKGLDTTELKKRPRTAFTPEQVKRLETEFQVSKYLSVAKRLELSRCLKLTETQVNALLSSKQLNPIAKIMIDSPDFCSFTPTLNALDHRLTISHHLTFRLIRHQHPTQSQLIPHL